MRWSSIPSSGSSRAISASVRDKDPTTVAFGAFSAIVETESAISVGASFAISAAAKVPFEKVKFSTEPVAYTGTSGASNTGMAKPPGGAGGSSSTTGASTSSPANMAKPNPWYPDHAVFNATKDELKAMPEFKYST